MWSMTELSERAATRSPFSVLGMLGMLYGAACYLFFLVTFLYVIGFLADVPFLPKTVDRAETVTPPLAAVLINGALLALFAVQHSVMARPAFKRAWTRIVPASLERSTYVLAATLAVVLLLWQWRPITDVVWSVTTPAAVVALYALQALGWAVLLLATFLINHFELFGLRQVLAAMRGRSVPEPEFRTPLLYKLVRHPLYLGFVIAFWAAPHMSVGHVLFAIGGTGYILVGIFFEERDLAALFGQKYREYQKRVPMLLPFGKSDGR
ncbi:MAG: isoprenylcysteine carboxylmethyltransferase family protein [Proteobacteria bacterium]|nr:isoprenylcysteine carboxylmethyltransferase family protein [Pseudomonadota bacterium]